MRLWERGRIALLAAFLSMLAGCATLGGAPPPAPTSVQTLEYYPFQVKGYQNSYPHRSILVLVPTDERKKADDTEGGSAPLDGNPQIGVSIGKDGVLSQRLYSAPLGPIVQLAIARAAEEAGMSAVKSSDAAYRAGKKLPQEYVVLGRIRECWVKKNRRADGRYGPVWRTTADFVLDVEIYKPPFSVPFWAGTAADTYYDPPVGSFGLGAEDEAGIYDEPGQVLSVALTRAVAGIFRRSDLRDLMLEDDIHPH
ncbi:MAG: hypothetical protein Q7S58_09185 [Candidatus Binatus sp.]|uniref:hypothetical protein n=1 Tax=Candidatus Binatus sp. TaxID=2811406 RepID=UPI002722936D|nr:hypothetical protein [Candidatus Binatus sp.]MDO8432568.1 hypothetical protein [Candidatus Binatus sp.]